MKIPCSIDCCHRPECCDCDDEDLDLDKPNPEVRMPRRKFLLWSAFYASQMAGAGVMLIVASLETTTDQFVRPLLFASGGLVTLALVSFLHDRRMYTRGRCDGGRK